MNFFKKVLSKKSEIRINRKCTSQFLKIGDRIKLRGGYVMKPLYLKNPPSNERTGQVIDFIYGQNKYSAAVIKLDHMITGEKITGEIAVIEPRHIGQCWECNRFNTVQIELCDFIPENKSWEDRKQGEWLEIAASWEILS